MDVHISVYLLFTGLIICYGQRCEDNKLRRCRDDIRRQTDRRVGDFQLSECRTLRENFDCLLDQTALCIHRESEREEYGKDLKGAHYILDRMCDETEDRDKSSCYERDSFKRCEEYLPRRKNNADPESCRKYQDFKDCAEKIVDSQCSRKDRDYLRTYYMVHAYDLPWKCTSDNSGRPDDPNNYRNRTNGRGQTCCKYENCDDRSRSRDCREELLRFIEGRTNYPSYNNNELCRTALNSFNCFLWHTYNCQPSHQKESTTMRQAKDYIEKKCSVDNDLRQSCFEQYDMKQCERRLSDESPSSHDVTCREYASFVNCVEGYLSRCNTQDELLQGIYLVTKAGEKAWTCSKSDSEFTRYPPYDPRFTDPYSRPTYHPGGNVEDDYACESQTRSEHRRCLSEKDRLDDETRKESNHREKHIKSCCVAYQFRECTRQVVRQVCSRERSSVVNSLMGIQMNSRIAECQDVEQTTCSASRMINNAMIIVLAFAMLRSIFF